MALPFEELVCKRPGCGELVRRKRLAQLYCSERCRNAVVQGRKRRKQAQQSGDAKGTDRGILGSGDGHTKNINEINAVQVGFLGGVPLLGDGQSLPSGWKGKLRLNLHDEAPGIGCGWRTLTVQVGPRRVSLCNHHTGDAARVGREVFERVVVGSGDCVLRSVAPRPEPPPKYANTARSGERGGVARQSGKIDERCAANTPSHRAWQAGRSC